MNLERLRRHPNVVAAVVTLALAAVMVGPALLPGRVLSSADIWWSTTPWSGERPADFSRPANPDLQDAAQQFQPLREEVKRQLPDAPLWDPWIAGGRPLLADAQSAVFSPFTLPAYAMSLQRSLVWTALLTLWAASFGMYLLGRALGMRFAGGLMAGLVYGLNLWLVAHLSYPHSAIWATLPWLLLASDRLVRRPEPLSVALLAGAVAVAYVGGHPESSFHVLLATVAFFALRLGYARRRERRPLRAPLVAFALALVAGTALAAVMLAPFLELLFGSADLAGRSGTGIDKHVDATYLLGFFLYDYWGRATHTALEVFLFARSWYVGALPLTLAAVALIRRPRGERLWIAGAAALLLAVIFGLPPFLQVATRLPLLSAGHNDRLIVIALACAALLAGWGFDDLCSREFVARHGRTLIAIAAVVLVLPLVMVALRGDLARVSLRTAIELGFSLTDPPPATDPAAANLIHMGTLVLWACLAGAALVLIVLRVRGLAAPAFVALALALVAADLLRAGMGYNPAIPHDRARQPVTGALRYLAAQGHARFVGVGDVPQNVISLRMRTQDARGYDLPIPKRYNKLWRREVSPEFPDLTSTFISLFLQVPRLDERRLRTLRLLGVTSVLAPPKGAVEPSGLDTPGLTPVYDGPDARVLRVDGALPRAFVAGAQQDVSGGDAALDALTRAGFDARNVVVSEKRLPGIATGDGTGGGAGAAGSARIASYQPDRVTIDAILGRPGVVVLGDNWFPGWKAKVDGKPANVERVDYVLRGVTAGRGRHRVELYYRPASWRIGWILSLLTLLALAGAIAVQARRGRAGRAAPAR